MAWYDGPDDVLAGSHRPEHSSTIHDDTHKQREGVLTGAETQVGLEAGNSNTSFSQHSLLPVRVVWEPAECAGKTAHSPTVAACPENLLAPGRELAYVRLIAVEQTGLGVPHGACNTGVVVAASARSGMAVARTAIRNRSGNRMPGRG